MLVAEEMLIADLMPQNGFLLRALAPKLVVALNGGITSIGRKVAILRRPECHGQPEAPYEHATDLPWDCRFQAGGRTGR